jgi:hypothetical protein
MVKGLRFQQDLEAVSYINVDPPKSPLKRGTFKRFSPLKKGARGERARIRYPELNICL